MTLSDTATERITVLYEVAKKNGSLISLKELVPLLPEATSEVELEEAINTSRSLGSRFELKSGYLTEKTPDTVSLLEAEASNRRRASRNLRYAAEFLGFLKSIPFLLVGVTGSTSYKSASGSKDLDLFCVAPSGRMWLSLTKGLIMSRAYNALRPSSPQICFSCVMDESHATAVFSSQQDPLFARDALNTIVLRGRPTYASLMMKGSWISGEYPSAYSALHLDAPGPIELGVTGAAQVALDHLLWVFIGSYLRLKAFLLNRRLTANNRPDDVFVVHSGPDHLVYESQRYRRLRQAYGTVRATGTRVQN